MGVRVEHPQEIIDSIQYNCEGTRDELLPAAAYSLVQQVNNRGVYSFACAQADLLFLQQQQAERLL